MLRALVSGVAGLIVGALIGVGITLAAVGLLSFAVGGTLNCSVQSDGTVSTCTNDQGQRVSVPHHIRIRQ